MPLSQEANDLAVGLEAGGLIVDVLEAVELVPEGDAEVDWVLYTES